MKLPLPEPPYRLVPNARYDLLAETLISIHPQDVGQRRAIYVMALAELFMPSWQSISKGADFPEMEEERRNCFVAITRVKQRLCLSWATRYGTSRKVPSRFLSEMKLT